MIVIQKDLKQFINKRIQNKILTERKALFNFVLRNSEITKGMLMLVINQVRKENNEVIIDDLIWIRRAYNLTYEITNAIILLKMVGMMEDGKLSYEVEQLVTRTIKQKAKL